MAQYDDEEIKGFLREAIAACRWRGLRISRDNVKRHGARGETRRQDEALETLVAEGFVSPEEYEDIKGRRARHVTRHRVDDRSQPRPSEGEKKPARKRPRGVDRIRALYWRSRPRKRAWYVRDRAEALQC